MYIRKLFSQIYALPLYKVAVIMIVAIILWQAIYTKKMYKHKREWRIINVALFTISLIEIFNFTIAFRGTIERVVILMPLHSLIEAKIQPEIYRTMVMNIFLFFPYGLSLPFTLHRKVTHKAIMTIASATICSVLVETTQYILSIGRCEADDVLMNTLGAALGCIAYCLTEKKWQFRLDVMHH